MSKVKSTKEEVGEAQPVYDEAAVRLEISNVLTKRLPALYEKYVEWIAKNDVAQGRWKPTFEHFMRWLKEYFN